LAGISSPRKATDGTELPSSREVSISVHRPTYANDPAFTVVLAVWGQFVDHDFTATALSHRKSNNC
jgi:peroxidase